ncbi:MAG: hypothetical protein FWH38_08895 [Treponema sp.]|nr:hypothetical protein [Treponema sp.]
MGMRILTLLLLTLSLGVLNAESLPEWIVPLREAVYEQKLSADDTVPVYLAAAEASRQRCSGTALDLALSRCEYLMGRALHFEKREKEANVHYHEGMRLAEKALEASPSPEAWLLRAENLSQTCAIGPWTYTMANGLNVEKFAKNALALNSRNAAAQYIVAARWVFAPAPFSNHKKGIEMMKEILDNGDMEKDDRFNVLSAIGYAYIQQKKNDEAGPWLLRSLEIYPTNKFVAGLLGNR